MADVDTLAIRSLIAGDVRLDVLSEEVALRLLALCDELDAARAALERVRALCDAQGDYVMVYALRRAIDGPNP